METEFRANARTRLESVCIQLSHELLSRREPNGCVAYDLEGDPGEEVTHVHLFQDLRRHVVDAMEQKEGSTRQIARRFVVSLSFVVRFLQIRRCHWLHPA
jgi:hypothetical protein